MAFALLTVWILVNQMIAMFGWEKSNAIFHFGHIARVPEALILHARRKHNRRGASTCFGLRSNIAANYAGALSHRFHSSLTYLHYSGSSVYASEKALDPSNHHPVWTSQLRIWRKELMHARLEEGGYSNLECVKPKRLVCKWCNICGGCLEATESPFGIFLPSFTLFKAVFNVSISDVLVVLFS